MKHKADCVLYTCCGSKCKKRGGKHLYKMLKEEIKSRGIKRNVQVIKTGCTDRCKHGPIVAAMPDNEWYMHVTTDNAFQILSRHIKAEV
jgi:(2Fe-2S) ferredoxin